MPKPGAVPRQRAPQGRAAWNRAGRSNFKQVRAGVNRQPPSFQAHKSPEAASFAWRTQRPSRTEVPSALRRNSRTLAPAAFSEELPRSRALGAGRFRAHRAGAPLDIVRLERRRRPRPGCPKQSDRRRRRRLEPDFVSERCAPVGRTAQARPPGLGTPQHVTPHPNSRLAVTLFGPVRAFGQTTHWPASNCQSRWPAPAGPMGWGLVNVTQKGPVPTNPFSSNSR